MRQALRGLRRLFTTSKSPPEDPIEVAARRLEVDAARLEALGHLDAAESRTIQAAKLRALASGATGR
jgi:hypothetical protein